MASSGTNRVNRGGSWNNDASNLRVANRNNWNPDNRNNNLGFRPANTGNRQPSDVHGLPIRAIACPADRIDSSPPFLGRLLLEKDWGNFVILIE